MLHGKVEGHPGLSLGILLQFIDMGCSVRISALALLKMAMHAKSGGNLEIMGMLYGKVQGDTFIVIDAFALPVEGTETRVNAQAEAYEYMVDFAETNKVGAPASQLHLIGCLWVSSPAASTAWAAHHTHAERGCAGGCGCLLPVSAANLCIHWFRHGDHLCNAPSDALIIHCTDGIKKAT